MKKLIYYVAMVLTILLVVLCANASAASHMADSFDFNSFAGDSDTFNLLPSDGDWGVWRLNNCTVSGSDKQDGVFSDTTSRGTSLVLKRQHTIYAGVYYAYKKSSYDVTDTIHVSFSWMAKGDTNNTNRFFRFRNRNNATFYNIISFNNNYTISVFDEVIKHNGVKLLYEKDKWYDIDVVYNVKTGFCNLQIDDESGSIWSHSGYSGYKDKLTAIQLVLFETNGPSTNGASDYIYIDDVSIETAETLYASNKVYDFEDFTCNSDGSRVPDGFMLTHFLPKSTELAEYAGVFTDEDSRGTSLSLKINSPKALALSGGFECRIDGAFEISTSLKLNSLDSDVNLILSDTQAKQKETVFTIKRNTGALYVFGKYSGVMIKPMSWHDIAVLYDPESRVAKLLVGSDALMQERYLTCDDTQLNGADKFTFALSSYKRISADYFKVLLDDIRLSEISRVCVPANEQRMISYVSKPLFFELKDGIYRKIDSIQSGEILASVNFR